MTVLPVDAVDELVPRRFGSRFPTMMRRLRRSPVGAIGVFIVILMVFTAVFAPLIAPHDPTKLQLGKRLRPPAWSEKGSWVHPLGTDQLGRDVWSRILVGSRISVFVGVSSVFIACIFGVLVGLLAGYRGGLADLLVSRVVDTFLAIPFIVLALTVVSVLGPSVPNLIVVLSLANWVSYARVVRAEVLSIKEREYVLAAHMIGQRGWMIAFRHMLPNVMASIIVMSTLNVASAITAESALSFLGLGVQPPTVTWGGMLADGRQHIATSWWLATFPGLAITTAVLGIIFLGDWLRDVLDPRLK